VRTGRLTRGEMETQPTALRERIVLGEQAPQEPLVQVGCRPIELVRRGATRHVVAGQDDHLGLVQISRELLARMSRVPWNFGGGP
jgi:hypothetical protein